MSLLLQSAWSASFLVGATEHEIKELGQVYPNNSILVSQVPFSWCCDDNLRVAGISIQCRNE